MSAEKWNEPYTVYEAPGDRLWRWMILGGDSQGRAKVVVAEKIRTPTVAKLFAEAPVMRDKLEAIQKITRASLADIGSLTPTQNSLRMIHAMSAIEQILACQD